MKIALYTDNHYLPFWHPSPQQPKELFNPTIHGAQVLAVGEGTQPIVESWIWPVLMGLHAIDIPVLAHVSAFHNFEKPGTWYYAYRTWVQITTLPTDVNDAGIPITTKDNKVIVSHLWGGDNGTYTPYELLDEGKRQLSLENSRPEFWHDFFVKRLKATKITVTNEARLALEKARKYSVIPD